MRPGWIINKATAMRAEGVFRGEREPKGWVHDGVLKVH